MNKKYLMKGMAALALLAGFSSCVKDVDGSSSGINEEQKAKENAELQLGLNIPDGQTWEMSTQLTAVVDVNLNPSETYTVGICDKNPLNYDDAKYYVLKKAEGGRISATFTAPKGKSDYYVIAYNSKYQAIVNQVNATNGAINANVTRTSGASGTMRSASNRAIAPTHNFTNDIPSKPTTTETAKITNSVPGNIPSYEQCCKNIRDANNWNYTPDEFSTGDCYIDANHTGKVKIYGGNSKLYVEGNCDMTTEGRTFNLGANMEIYLIQGATFKVPSGFASGTKVYMASGSSLIINSGVSTGDVCYYSNGGSITVKGNLIINAQKELFMEGGKFIVEGLFQMQPANVYLHNTDVEISGKIDVNHGWNNNTNSNIPALYYQDGGSFKKTGSDLVCNSGIFYTTVDTKFTSIEANGTGIIVNKAGTMTSTGNIRVTNNNSVLINDGDLVGAYLGTEGSAHFQNNGTATISGMTLVNSNNNTWVNNGTYQTEYFNYNAGSSDVINNCRMIVKEDFNINLGDNPGTSCFKMDSHASVLTKNFNGGQYSFSHTYWRSDWNKEDVISGNFSGGPFHIYMGESSVFEVTKTATMRATKADYGIYGPETGEYAVFKAKDIVKGGENQQYQVTYGNNLAVVCETHFAQGNDGQADHPFIGFKGNASIFKGGSFAEGKAGSVAPNMEKISASLCNPGFDPGEGDGNKFLPEPQVYTFAFEDQKVNGDYDMNDVVLQMSYVPTRDNQGRITAIDEKKLDVKLVAAGAQFSIKVYIGEEALFNDKEVHEAFKLANSGMNIVSNSMVNTGTKANFNGAKPATCQISLPDWDGNFENLDVKIVVNGKTNSPIKYLEDKIKATPYSIMIPNNWRWPQERTIITDAYPGEKIPDSNNYNDALSFKKWAETTGADRDDIDWYNYPVTGKTFSLTDNATNN